MTTLGKRLIAAAREARANRSSRLGGQKPTWLTMDCLAVLDPTPTLATAGIDADHSNRNVEVLKLGVLLIFFAWPALIASGQ